MRAGVCREHLGNRKSLAGYSHMKRRGGKMWLGSHQGGALSGIYPGGDRALAPIKSPSRCVYRMKEQEHVGSWPPCSLCPCVQGLFSQLWRSAFTNLHSSSYSLMGSNSILLAHHFYRCLLNKCL